MLPARNEKEIINLFKQSFGDKFTVKEKIVSTKLNFPDHFTLDGLRVVRIDITEKEYSFLYSQNLQAYIKEILAKYPDSVLHEEDHFILLIETVTNYDLNVTLDELSKFLLDKDFEGSIYPDYIIIFGNL